LGMIDTTSELVDALKTLAPRQRAVLVLRYFHDLPASEVAEILGCTVGTVKSTTSRALDRLRELPGLVPVGCDHLDTDPQSDTKGDRHDGSRT
jgi:DNA-binding CsgD family transcriptional regulator